MKVYVIQSQTRIKLEWWCECKELDDLSSCKDDYMWKPSTYDFEYNKACKIDEHLDIQNCSFKKRV